MVRVDWSFMAFVRADYCKLTKENSTVLNNIKRSYPGGLSLRHISFPTLPLPSL